MSHSNTIPITHSSSFIAKMMLVESSEDDFYQDPFGTLELETRKAEVEKGISDFTLDTVPWTIRLAQDMSGGCGGKIWEAANMMISYLVDYPQDFKNKRILELGSGTGLVGLAVAKSYPDVKSLILTDQEPLMNLLRENIALNDVAHITTASVLNWGEPLPDSIAPGSVDVILASDCVYLEVAFEPLIHTLLELSSKDTLILMSYRKRRKADKRFFQMARKHFTLHEGENDAKQDAYLKDGLRLYILKKK
ncbi:putative methyltransferase-domain-containing protein [Radiomyces spectabilis]|uniref:putative methyltransferase-domain-containing protein n=1 Tax=Radiomyces spectabilis TaxID=64574 RepID=UPI00221F817A|nr:putative methyltransferase-domain-containing protein [Radiomyces spectabilis]KAI8379469.1 putative methyltransferase-domain-containing protein [Radiomyces spectabilis]